MCKETPPPPAHPAAGGTLAHPRGQRAEHLFRPSAQSSSRTSSGGKRTACSRRFTRIRIGTGLAATAAAGPIRRIPAGLSPDRCRSAALLPRAANAAHPAVISHAALIVLRRSQARAAKPTIKHPRRHAEKLQPQRSRQVEAGGRHCCWQDIFVFPFARYFTCRHPL